MDFYANDLNEHYEFDNPYDIDNELNWIEEKMKISSTIQIQMLV